MRDDVFYAVLVLASGVEVSARPSDSIALALRTGVADRVRRGACSTRPGSSVPDEQEDEVEKFREFLDQVSPEDFERRPLSRTDPQPQVKLEGCATRRGAGR